MAAGKEGKGSGESVSENLKRLVYIVTSTPKAARDAFREGYDDSRVSSGSLGSLDHRTRCFNFDLLERDLDAVARKLREKGCIVKQHRVTVSSTDNSIEITTIYEQDLKPFQQSVSANFESRINLPFDLEDELKKRGRVLFEVRVVT